MLFLSDFDSENSSKIKPFLGRESQWLSWRKIRSLRGLRRNKATVVFIAVEQSLSLNDS